MPRYVVIECPLCEARRPIEAENVSRDASVRAMARHLLEAHPATGPSDAEQLLEEALEQPTVHESDEPLTEIGRWITGPLHSDDSDGESGNGSSTDRGNESDDDSEYSPDPC